MDADATPARGMAVVNSLTVGAPPILDNEASARCSPGSRPIAATTTAAARVGRAELPGALRRPARLSVFRRRFLEDAAGACAGACDPRSPCSPSIRSDLGAGPAEGDGEDRARARRSGARAGGRNGRSAGARRGSRATPRRRRSTNARGRASRARQGREAPGLRADARPRASTSPARTTRLCARRCWISSRSTRSWTRPTSGGRDAGRALRVRRSPTTSARLRRVLVERAMHAGGFIEDGGSVDSGESGPSGRRIPALTARAIACPTSPARRATRRWPRWAS